jgi:ribonuclease HII
MAVEQYLVGIDEAGRGPIAGPVAVGALWCQSEAVLAEMLAFFPKNELRDSKKTNRKAARKNLCQHSGVEKVG